MKQIIAGILITAGAVSGCRAQSASNPGDTASSTSAPVPIESGSDMEFAPSDTAQAVADEVIGMSESEAIETITGISSETLSARVVRRDDESYIITMDYRPDRINLEIDDAIVTKTNIG